MSNLVVNLIRGLSADNYAVTIPQGNTLSFNGELIIPSWSTSTRPIETEIGIIGYNITLQKFEIYLGSSLGWQGILIGSNPEDTGAGGGWSISQGADGANITGYTTTAMTQYVDSWYLSAGGSGGGGILNYVCSGSSASFHWHTGHNANSSQWPLYYAVNVTSAEKGKVLNQIQWYKHSNAIGNVDVFGTNLAITSSNYRSESNYTFLGRVNMGGYGSSADCNISTGTFNSNSYGYKWYMLKLVDISGSLAYPNVGSLGGWAMYGMRLNKI